MTKFRAAEEGGSIASGKSGSGHKNPLRRRVPLRMCIACRRTGSKRALIRLVRTPNGGVQVDTTGKLAGRGAYLCENRSCWEQGLRSQRLSQALKISITPEEIETLRAFAATLPEKSTEGEEQPTAATPSQGYA